MTNPTISHEVHSIKCHVVTDENPDLSWLEQDCWNEATEDEPEGYGRRRIAEYGQTWEMMGVYVTLHDEYGGEIARSGGLWGIESDSGDDYFASVATAEVGELEAQHGIDLSSFEIED